jgi:hypothetical protein
LQAEGAELPELGSTFAGEVGDQLDKLAEFTTGQGIKLEYSDKIAPARGMCYGGVIRILPNMEPSETLATFVLQHYNLAVEVIRVGSFAGGPFKFSSGKFRNSAPALQPGALATGGEETRAAVGQPLFQKRNFPTPRRFRKHNDIEEWGQGQEAADESGGSLASHTISDL